MKRRDFLQDLATLSAFSLLWPSSRIWALNQAVKVNTKKTLLVIFQRGAADGLSMVSPLGDSYFNKSLRPNLFLTENEMLKLDSFFYLHPSLKSFKELWDTEQLSVIHQVGSPSNSRSHFDAQDFFESGTPDIKSTETGFLARASQKISFSDKQSISSLAVQANLPRFLSGDSKAISFSDLNRFSIKQVALGASGSAKGFEDFFESAIDEVVKGQGSHLSTILDSFNVARKVKLEQEFAKNQISTRLRDIAKIIKSGMNVPILVTEAGGWDTHNNQGSNKGQLPNKLSEFSEAIAVLVKELGPKMKDVCIVTITEFGRTVRENGSKGTDHGHGACYFVIGGGIKPKSIHADWKTLKKENLFEERDLPATTDFRDVFQELLAHQFGLKDFTSVFPDYKTKNKLKLFV